VEQSISTSIAMIDLQRLDAIPEREADIFELFPLLNTGLLRGWIAFQLRIWA
jgi:hypothetical protein